MNGLTQSQTGASPDCHDVGSHSGYFIHMPVVNCTTQLAQLVERWRIGFNSWQYRSWTWNSFYGHSHCTTAMACIEVTSSSWASGCGKILNSLHKMVLWLNNALWHCCDPEGKQPTQPPPKPVTWIKLKHFLTWKVLSFQQDLDPLRWRTRDERCK